MEPGALDKKSAAAYLGIGMRTLERLINRGEIPIIKLERRVIIRKEALDEFLKAREHRRGHGEGEAEGETGQQ
jgi:excisionase family DNA binding protein